LWGKRRTACTEYRIFISIIYWLVAAKKTFVLRVDEEVYKALEKWAADEFRSVNGQIEFLIDVALKKAGRKKSGIQGKEKIEK
jgi:hypothetical protein